MIGFIAEGLVLRGRVGCSTTVIVRFKYSLQQSYALMARGQLM